MAPQAFKEENAFLRFAEILKNCRRAVFFGGAGISTESGIPDFRGTDGLYQMQYRYPPEEILSHSFYCKQKAAFFEFYRDKMLVQNNRHILPNAAHNRLAELEQKHRIAGIITQNIDGLHQAAGAKNVVELHGSIHRNYCRKCGKFYDASYIAAHVPIPVCCCGGDIKPSVVLYEEPLAEVDLARAVSLLQHADALIVGGTSLSVYPAAGLLQYFRGGPVVLINQTPTPMDAGADLVFREKAGTVFDRVCALANL